MCLVVQPVIRTISPHSLVQFTLTIRWRTSGTATPKPCLLHVENFPQPLLVTMVECMLWVERTEPTWLRTKRQLYQQAARQIGRASCRGKSVDLGGRRSMKKKKESECRAC